MSGQLLQRDTRQAFARHETFHARFGWLKKGYDACAQDPGIFQRPDATVRLGVGKNMVNAIRYWGQAFKVLEERRDPDRPRMPHLVPSPFGDLLLSEVDGLDPYLENPASLWLLHWQLLKPVSLAPTWWVAFNLVMAPTFDEEALVSQISELANAAGWPQVVDSSIQKDVECLIRTYTIRHHGRQTWDDMLDCPFRELNLLEAVPGSRGRWRYITGLKATLTPGVVLYASLDFLADSAQGEASISVARLCNDPGGPGRAFRLAEADLYRLLADAAQISGRIHVREPGGLRQLIVDGDIALARDEALKSMYDPSTVYLQGALG